MCVIDVWDPGACVQCVREYDLTNSSELRLGKGKDRDRVEGRTKGRMEALRGS